MTDGAVVAELTAMARESKKLPFSEYRDILSAEAIRYLQYEANASLVRQVALEVVPGLLQTEEYSRAGEHSGRSVLGRSTSRAEFPDENDPDVIFIENTSGDTLFRDDPETTARYQEQFLTLEDLSTRPGDFEDAVRFTES